MYVLFARGSGAKWFSEEAWQFRQNIYGALGDIGITKHEWAELGNLDQDYDEPDRIEPGEYPAVPGINLSPTYGASVEIGTRELITHLNQRYSPWGRNCYDETVVLGGYSQGADVIGWALNWGGPDGLNEYARSHIGFVALYGDPRNANLCPAWWARGNARCGTAPWLGARDPYVPPEYRGRFGSWCDDGDGMCASNLASIGYGNHTEVYKQYWIWNSRYEIAFAAARKLALLNPHQGTGVGNAGYLNSDRLYANQVMYPNSYVMSPDGNFVLILQQDGNLVLYGPRYQPIWQTGTAGQAVGSVIMQPDGNLVMYSPSGQPVWYSGVNGVPGAQLRVQADGNLVEYNGANQPVWQTNTSRPMPALSYAGSDKLSVNQTLGQNQYLRSSDGTRFLQLQTDGNLVLYGPGRHLLWHTTTGGTGSNLLKLQPDGNLVLLKPDGEVAWHTYQGGTGGNYVKMQSDGNLVQYDPSYQAVWWSGTAGQK